MKRTVSFCLFLLLILLGAQATADVSINMMNFPDDAFREYVTKFDDNRDGTLSEEEIAQVKTIDAWGEEYHELTGLEYFTSLEELSIYGTQVTDLDLYDNTELKKLECSSCRLTELDVSQCKKLEELDCSGNSLEALDVSRLAGLRILKCKGNHLKSLDVSKNSALQELDCVQNELRSLDVSANTLLVKLSCAYNKIAKLNLSKNKRLTELICGSNQLASLDLSENTALLILSCYANRLARLDVSMLEKLTELYCSTNQLTELNVRRNPDLQILVCSSNQLTSLDVSRNRKLIDLDFSDNKLSEINLKSNPNLLVLACMINQLTGLDVSHQRNVIWLLCEHNRFRTLDVRNCRYINRAVNRSEPTYYDYAKVNEWRDESQSRGGYYGVVLSTDSSVNVLTGKDEVPVSGIKLNKKEATLTRTSSNKNPTLKLKATVTPTGASDKKLVWSSSKPDVVQVDSKGNVTALKAGYADIICEADYGSHQARAVCTIKVTDKLLSRIVLNLDRATLKKGKTLKLKVKTFKPTTALKKKVRWTSSDERIAVVNNNGKVTAKRKGECEIICTAADGSGVQAVCKIKVE